MTTVPEPARTDSATLCPACGSALTSDPRFVQWCRACDWNADPRPQETAKRVDRFRRGIGPRAEERLYRRIAEGRTGRSSLDGATLGAYVLAGLVHLVTLGLVVGGAVLLVGHGLPLRALAVVMLAVAVVLRPRLGPGRAERRALHEVGHDAAPTLYALTDRVAGELGTAAPSLIVVDDSYRAVLARRGPRRRVVLALGLPLWETLSPGQRLALLGHELGHGGNGDPRQGLWVGSALDSLSEWHRLFRPGRARQANGAGKSMAGGLAVVGELITVVLLSGFAEVTLLVNRLLSRLTTLAGRRAEYLADELAVRVAGRDAVVELLGALTLGSAAAHVRQRRRLGRGGPVGVPATDFWTDLRAYVTSIPESERARRLLVSRNDDVAVDAAHPPTRLRLGHVLRLPDTTPSVVVTPGELAAIDAELAPLRAAVAETLT